MSSFAHRPIRGGINPTNSSIRLSNYDASNPKEIGSAHLPVRHDKQPLQMRDWLGYLRVMLRLFASRDHGQRTQAVRLGKLRFTMDRGQ